MFDNNVPMINSERTRRTVISEFLSDILGIQESETFQFFVSKNDTKIR